MNRHTEVAWEEGYSAGKTNAEELALMAHEHYWVTTYADPFIERCATCPAIRESDEYDHWDGLTREEARARCPSHEWKPLLLYGVETPIQKCGRCGDLRDTTAYPKPDPLSHRLRSHLSHIHARQIPPDAEYVIQCVEQWEKSSVSPRDFGEQWTAKAGPNDPANRVARQASPFYRWPKGTMARALAELQVRWRQLVRKVRR